MPEENKQNPPQGNTEGQNSNANTGPVKSAETLVAELKESNESNAKLKEQNEKNEKRIQDKENFINRQADELGELRKPSDQDTNQNLTTRDSMVKDLMERKGLSKEDAEYNVDLLDVSKPLIAKEALGVVNKVLSDRIMLDVGDMVEDALDEGKMDRPAFNQLKDEIMKDFKERKLKPTAYQNFKMFKRCYDSAVKKKADVLRDTNLQEDEKNRENLINSGQVPAGGKNHAPNQPKETTRDDIKNAGPKRNNEFF